MDRKINQHFKDAAPQTHRKLYGTAMALCCVFFAALLGYSVLYIAALPWIPRVFALLLEAYFLKATFAINCLLSPARRFTGILKQTGLRTSGNCFRFM